MRTALKLAVVGLALGAVAVSVACTHNGECAAAGDQVGGKHDPGDTIVQCCPGLIPGRDVIPSPDCDLVAVDSAICIACGDGVCGSGENFCNCPEDCSRPDAGTDAGTDASVACVEAGAALGDPHNYPGRLNLVCCAGLTVTQDLVPGTRDPPATDHLPPGCDVLAVDAPGLCLACGDGICGVSENFCNCPQDCPPPDAGADAGPDGGDGG
jgi:hypothetical protein